MQNVTWLLRSYSSRGRLPSSHSELHTAIKAVPLVDVPLVLHNIVMELTELHRPFGRGLCVSCIMYYLCLSIYSYSPSLSDQYDSLRKKFVISGYLISIYIPKKYSTVISTNTARLKIGKVRSP